MLSLVVKHMLYLPSQIIINKGDIGHHMYFIRKGEVEVCVLEVEDRSVCWLLESLIQSLYVLPNHQHLTTSSHVPLFLPSTVVWHSTVQHATTVLVIVHTAQCTIVPINEPGAFAIM